jgi:hypothetical protein
VYSKQKLEELGARPIKTGWQFFPFTDDELEGLEKRFDAKLPASYRAFLNDYGGCSFDVDVAVRLRDGSLGAFNCFFGSEKAPDGDYSIAKELASRQETPTWNRIQPFLMPLAENWGNLYCLGIAGEEYGRVYYWDHENEPLHPDQYLEDFGRPMPREHLYCNLTLVADTFDEFIDRLIDRDKAEVVAQH